MRSYWWFLLPVCTILVQQRCENSEKSGDREKTKDTVKVKGAERKDSLLFRTWFHSYEDDRGDTLVYRPDSYDFPLSRGRHGFRIEKEGEWTGYRIGRADRPEKVSGNWKWQGRDTLKVHFNNKRDYFIRFFKVTDSLLVLKKWVNEETEHSGGRE